MLRQIDRILFLAVLSLVLCASPLIAVPDGYTLMFEDEFVGRGLNPNIWSFNYPWGTFHNHRANCRPEQITFGNGVLKITAVHERSIWDPQGIWHDQFGWLDLDYTSGAINTSGKFNFTYGYVEGRFKMPHPRSTWPAFWMLQDGWPPEIDIFEVQDDRNRYYYNYHYGPDWQHHYSFGGEYWGPDLSEGWHVYGLEWKPGELAFYFDDVEIRRFQDASAISQAGNMYLIINLAVGGWAPAPNPDDYPANLECDWIRVYERTPGAGLPEPGLWYTITARHSQRVMDVTGGEDTTQNRANIQQWEYWGGKNQQWMLTEASDGYYYLSPRHAPDKCLDVEDWSTADGGNLIQWTCTGGTNQQWKIEDAGDGYCTIISRYTDKVVDVSGVSLDNGANIHQWTYNGGDNQLWDFRLVLPQCPFTSDQGDFNGDCTLDFHDFAVIAQYWMLPCPAVSDPKPFQEDCFLDFLLLKEFSQNWLSCAWLPAELCPDE